MKKENVKTEGKAKSNDVKIIMINVAVIEVVAVVVVASHHERKYKPKNLNSKTRNERRKAKKTKGKRQRSGRKTKNKEELPGSRAGVPHRLGVFFNNLPHTHHTAMMRKENDAVCWPLGGVGQRKGGQETEGREGAERKGLYRVGDSGRRGDG